MTRIHTAAWAIACAVIGAMAITIVALLAGTVAAGPLDPPPPAAGPTGTQKTQNEIEPRTPISSLPYTISAPGSYYVTGNLTGVAGSHGIEVTADNVTLDLNGFSLTGVPGSWTGVFSWSTGLQVRNGTVTAWGANGVQLNGGGYVVESLRAVSNGLRGISMESGVLRDCVAIANGGEGIFAENSAVTGCVARENLDTGIVVHASSLEGCESIANRTGIWTNGSRVAQCTVDQSGGHGIYDLGDSNIKDNVVLSSGWYGIYMGGPGSYVSGNNMRNNATAIVGAGLYVIGPGNRIEGNHSADQDVGFQVAGTGNTLFGNSARGNTTNYVIGGVNDVGPISTAAAAGSPWANISN